MELLTVILVPVLALLIPTVYAGYIGAPYAPTFIAVVRKAFDALRLDESDFLVDLGAGDGKIVLEAGRRGAEAVGYELSPIMWAVIVCRIFGKSRVHAKFGNFYKMKLPEETTVVFAFLMPKHMGEVLEFIQHQNLPRLKYVLAYAFPFPGEVTPLTIIREPKCAPLYVYDQAAFAEAG